MTALHITGDLTGPRCGASLDDIERELLSDSSHSDGPIQIRVGCLSCNASLAVIVESAAPEAIGVDVWVEDRREVDGS